MALVPSKLTILQYPHSKLRARARPIEETTDLVRQVAARMLELMHEAPGVGLACPQVGLPWRMFVANPSQQLDDDWVFINPVLSNHSQQTGDRDEGCLSIPGVIAEIRRPLGVTVSALDLQGNPIEQVSDELSARIWQHECDHLDGTLIIDRMTKADRLANKRAIRDLEAAVR